MQVWVLFNPHLHDSADKLSHRQCPCEWGKCGKSLWHLVTTGLQMKLLKEWKVSVCKQFMYIYKKDSDRSKCNISNAWRDQMSSSDSVATTTENASRLGYKHVCVNYLHVASRDYQEVIQHTHTHIHTLAHSLNHSIFFSLNSHLSFNTNSSGEWKFQKLLNQKHKSQACHKQTKEGTKFEKPT